MAQEVQKDSSVVLDEIIVRSFEQNKTLKSAVSPVHIIRLKDDETGSRSSLVSLVNTAPGVRMEERSPGSYRLNIRGSSLRSPFGVRNIKVYWSDIPLTDPGGNTYLNQLAWNNIATMEIFKGPAASMYGAGTGGLILINPIGSWQPGISAEYTTGSYNLQNVFVTARFGHKQNMNQFSFSHNSNDGYRNHSKISRDNLSWVSQLILSERQQFTASFLYSDLYYQTPGGLTFNEYKANPRSSRPAAGGLPSAEASAAAIKQTSFLAGFSHTYKVNEIMSNQTTFYGSFVELNNPAIRNYERRTEPGFGGRTLFEFHDKEEEPNWKVLAGAEFQHGFFNTIVFKNLGGKPDTLQTNDDIVNTLNTYFLQGDATIHETWFFTAGFSVNRSKVSVSRLNQYPINTRTRYYRDEIAPRFVLKKSFNKDLSVTASLSRGYSPPTVAELLPSNSVISTYLEAESGWNYELNSRYYLLGDRLRLEASAFYFKLNNALVQRRDSTGADYFVNAGHVNEKGLELLAAYNGVVEHGFLSSYEIQGAFTFNHFRYGSFSRGTVDYSGKNVPSVPGNTVSFIGGAKFRKGMYAGINYYSAGKIYLNDDNSGAAKAYHLLAARVGIKKTLRSKFVLDVFAGVENIFNEHYSLGNDINAAAGRYYNAAPQRNYYGGISLQWLSPKK
jgi:iron complex outermembrane receptor protein